MEKTLIHEDIYVYVDEVFEQITSKKITSGQTIVNDATGLVADKGILIIKPIEQNASNISITCNGKTININSTIIVGTTLIVDLRKNFYEYDGTKGLLDECIIMEDNKANSIKITFTGSKLEVEYRARIASESETDLMFCTSVDVSTNNDIMSFKNIKGVTKNYKNAHGTHSWSINIIWNEDEAEKFKSSTGELRIRLIDLDGRELETLGNCYVNSIQTGSSDSGDYTLSVSGVCDKIF